jgi:hypothetical protein
VTELAIVQTIDVENPDVNDLKIQNGQLFLIDGDEAIAQHIRVRFQFFRGEWFLDVREGFPYFEEVFVKAPNLNAVRGFARDTLLTTPGVTAINQLSVTLDSAIRQARIDFVVTLATGSILRSEDFEPFILQV